MKKRILMLLTGALLLLLMTAGCDLGTVAAGGNNADGTTRWLNGTTKDGSFIPFRAFLGYGKQDITSRMNKTWDYFIGQRDPKANSTIYFDVPGDPTMAYIFDNDKEHQDVRSEGMSYGMMIAVQLGKKNTFNKLLKFVLTYMVFPSGKLQGYLRWRVKPNGEPITGASVAPDGDIYFAMALLLAADRWKKDKNNPYQYDDLAWRSMERMLNHNDDDENEISCFTTDHLVKHWPDGPGVHINPSYHMPAFFKFFAEHPIYKKQYRDPNGSKKEWAQIAAASRTFLKAATGKSTYMLTANTTYATGSPTPFGKTVDHTECFRHDAWRVAMNITLDADWNGSENWGNYVDFPVALPWVSYYSGKLCNFFESKNTSGKRNYQDQWKTNGAQYTYGGTHHSAGLVGMNAMAACLMSDQNNSIQDMRDRYLQELWDLDPSEITNYYSICLYTLAMLWATGNYNLY